MENLKYLSDKEILGNAFSILSNEDLKLVNELKERFSPLLLSQKRTASEYRELMISVMNLSIAEAEKNAEGENDYYEGYLQGLYEGKRNLEASKFLTE